MDQQKGHVEVYGLSYLVKRLTHQDKLLIVDDVFDTGRTIDAVVNQLHKLLRKNLPEIFALPPPTTNRVGER